MNLTLIGTLTKRMYYSLKLMLSAYFIGALALAVILSIVTVNIEQWHFNIASVDTLIMMFTVAFPLVTVMLTGNMFAEDLEERVFPMIWTYPVRKWLFLIERVVVLVIILAVYFAATLGAIHYGLMELTQSQVWDIIKYSGPTHLCLAGITLLSTLLGRNLLTGIAVGTGYWLIEVITRGQWTKKLFVFNSVWSLENVDLESNLWWVFGLGCLLIALSAGMFIAGRHWIAKH